MFKKKNKIKYVPDEEVLAYGKQNKAEIKDDIANTEEASDITSDSNESEAVKEAAINETATENGDDENNTDISENNDNSEADVKKKKRSIVKIIGTVIPKKGDGVKRVVLKSVAIIASLGIVASACYLVFYFSDLGVQNNVVNRQRAIYDLNRYDYKTSTAEGYLAKFSELKRQNSDLIGWISIDGTEVDNPVYQRDNDFYLNHDMNGSVNSYGSLFLDELCDIYPSRRTQNQIIYGHNMRYGAMFGTLDEYRDVEYYKDHPTITFDSLWEHNEYKIFAVMITNDTTDSTFGYSFSPYRNNFVNQEDFLLWTEYCKQRSLYNTDVDIKPDDEVITLSTCCYDFDEARLILVGRLVREGESSEVNVDNAVVNQDVIYPKEYYDKKKLPIPEIEPPTVNIYER